MTRAIDFDYRNQCHCDYDHDKPRLNNVNNVNVVYMHK